MGYVSSRFECDVCKAAKDTDGRIVPTGWYTAQVEGRGLGIGGIRMYVCSRPCLDRLLADGMLAAALPEDA